MQRTLALRVATLLCLLPALLRIIQSADAGFVLQVVDGPLPGSTTPAGV